MYDLENCVVLVLLNIYWQFYDYVATLFNSDTKFSPTLFWYLVTFSMPPSYLRLLFSLMIWTISNKTIYDTPQVRIKFLVGHIKLPLIFPLFSQLRLKGCYTRGECVYLQFIKYTLVSLLNNIKSWLIFLFCRECTWRIIISIIIGWGKRRTM